MSTNSKTTAITAAAASTPVAGWKPLRDPAPVAPPAPQPAPAVTFTPLPTVAPAPAVTFTPLPTVAPAPAVTFTPNPAPQPAPKKTRKPRKPAAIAAPQPILLLLPANVPTPTPTPKPQRTANAPVTIILAAWSDTTLAARAAASAATEARRATRAAARTAAVARGKAAGAAATTAAIEALNTQRRALLTQGIPTQTLPAEARQPLYARDMREYTRTVVDVVSMTVIFKVSALKRVVWFKLDNCYVRECVQDGQPVHLTVFRTPEAAEIPEAPAGAEALDFAA